MSIELFNRGLKAHKSGDLNAATQYYQQFLKVAPREHNALQLLGVVLHARGDNEGALKYMLASLKIKPNQPQVMLNVASCQRQLGLFDDALKTLNTVIKRDPANFAAFKGRMNVLVEMKDYQQAYKELSRQISQFPGHYELYNLLGAVASDCEDHAKAIHAYQKAIRIRPGSDVARHNLGLAYRNNGEPEKALKEYQLVLNSGKHSHQLMHNLGNAYADIGHLEQAVTFFNNALKLNYAHLETHIDLNEVLWEMGDKKHFLRSLQKAMSLYPDEPAFLFHYAKKLCQTSSYKEARDVLESKRSILGETAEFKMLFGECLLAAGDKDSGIKLLHSVTNHHQLNAQEHLHICEILIQQQSFQVAEKALNEILRTQPHNTTALAYWGLCLKHREDKKEGILNNYTQLVREYKLFDPIADARLYNNLMDAVSKMHAVKEKPIEQTLINGTQTRGHLFNSDNPVIKELTKRIHKCVATYIEQVSPNKNQWLDLPEASNVQFTSSSSAKLRSGGYHSGHIHAEGKLSATVYLSLPNAIKQSSNGQGELIFGKPGFDNEDKFRVQHRTKPEVGKLVIFPSYCWHGTQPVKDASPRITISFDMR